MPATKLPVRDRGDGCGSGGGGGGSGYQNRGSGKQWRQQQHRITNETPSISEPKVRHYRERRGYSDV